jgi:hypothetical protein
MDSFGFSFAVLESVLYWKSVKQARDLREDKLTRTEHQGGYAPVSLRRCETPPVWSHARKILAVDFDLRDLKAPMLPQLLTSLPETGRV